MKINVGSTDKIVRYTIAAVIAYLLISSTVAITSIVGIILAIVAVIMVGTSLTSSCPIYSLAGLSSKK